MIDYNKHYSIRELCDELGYEYKKTHGVRVKEEIERSYELEQITKQKYRVVKELSEDEKDEIKFSTINKDGKYDNFNIPHNKRHDSGVYKIQLDNIVYIGQTTDFMARYGQHYSMVYSNKRIKKILDCGATFEAMYYENDRDNRLKLEATLAEKYKTQGYDIINTERVLYKKHKKYKNIKIELSNYDKAIKLLKENNLI